MATVRPGTPTARAPRRLSREARREQLVAAALPVVAHQGFSEFSLDEIADRADVTRNLLYHYFRRGRPDIVLSVVRLAYGQLAAGWDFDPDRPAPERTGANFAWIAGHALAPSDAWRIHRRCRSADDPELRIELERMLDLAVATVSLNQLGTPDAPPLVRVALRGYVALAETVLEEARETGTPRKQIVPILLDTLGAAVRAGQGR